MQCVSMRAAAFDTTKNTAVRQYTHVSCILNDRAKQLALGTMMMREHRAKEVTATTLLCTIYTANNKISLYST
jgi:hypothetical protein